MSATKSTAAPRRPPPAIPTRAEIRAERVRRARDGLDPWCRLHSYTPARHHRLLIERLEAVSRGEIRRLLVFMPPGSAKSTYATVLFPPWFMGRHPGRSVITASYGQRLSRRFGKKCRNLVAGAPFREVFGFGLATGAKAADEWETESGGEFTATSVDGSVTGRRGDLIIIDDPVKGRKEADSLTVRETAWEWWKSDLRTRLKPGGAIVIIQTRWHEDDVAGRILPDGYDGDSGVFQARDGEDWHVLSLRAEAEAGDPLGREPGEFLWPEWFSGGELEQEKRSQGPRNWNALYQQRPSPDQGSYFLRDWLHTYDAAPAAATMRVYAASDYAVTAEGGDFTVHIVVGVDPDDRMYVLDLWRGQTASDVWVETMLDLAQRWKPLEWAEETGQIRASLGPFIQRRMQERQTYVAHRLFPTRGDKAVRAQAIRGRMALKGLYLPRNAEWGPGFISELLTFPAGRHDDQADALGLIGQLLDRIRPGTRPAAPAPVADPARGIDVAAEVKALARAGKRRPRP